jgi:MFS family permease
VRLFGTFAFDRTNKVKLLLVALLMLTACLLALPGVKTLAVYYLLAVAYGAGIGITMPVFSALLFNASAPGLRSLNTNMTLFVMDAGFFLTPYLGGLLMTLGASFSWLFYAAAFYVVMILFLTLLLRKEGDIP